MSDYARTDEPKEPVVKPFAAFLQENKRGRLHEELSVALHELIAAVEDTGKSGTLVLKLRVEKQKKTRYIEVSDTVTSNKPARDRENSVWFVDPDGNLSRDDHTQLPLGIQVVTPTSRKEAQ